MLCGLGFDPVTSWTFWFLDIAIHGHMWKSIVLKASISIYLSCVDIWLVIEIDPISRCFSFSVFLFSFCFSFSVFLFVFVFIDSFPCIRRSVELFWNDNIFFHIGLAVFHVLQICLFTCSCSPGLAQRNSYGWMNGWADLCRVMGRAEHSCCKATCPRS